VKPAGISRITELAMNSNYNNIRDLYMRINEFRRGYQPRSNSLKGQIGYLLADFHKILIWVEEPLISVTECI
jgi:hypothetical protein